ncbi:MAG: hypothetical protein J7L22_00085, partial [Candidatus Marinimicrobia bacterium]|nr:hypothetical protein [Candidatus Neomarinimicrobiota bacterium]
IFFDFSSVNSYLTLAGFRGIEISRTILKGLNVNNIRQSLVKERIILPPSKTPKVFNKETRNRNLLFLLDYYLFKI